MRATEASTWCSVALVGSITMTVAPATMWLLMPVLISGFVRGLWVARPGADDLIHPVQPLRHVTRDDEWTRDPMFDGLALHPIAGDRPILIDWATHPMLREVAQ
jgi:hypothetical protein